MKRLLICLLILLQCVSLQARLGHNVFTTNNCFLLKRRSLKPFVLVLYRGQDLLPSLLRCAHEGHLKSVVFSGAVGALENVTISYYDRDDKKAYLKKFFKGPYELISLNGNMAWIKNDPMIHAHASLGTRDYHLFGGHVAKATVAVTTELLVTPFSSRFERLNVKGHPQLFLIQNEK